MLYHYTTSRAAESIRREGVILAYPALVYRSLEGPLLGHKPHILQPPVVWLTINPLFDLTVVTRESVNGLRIFRAGDFCRFGVSDETAPLGLAEWAEKHGHDFELFRWMVATGELAGSNYTTWRLAERPIPATEWKTVQVFNGLKWEKVNPT